MHQHENADLQSLMWHHPLPRVTLWVVTRVTWICPHRTLENVISTCHVSSILPCNDDISCYMAPLGPIVFPHMPPWRREKRFTYPWFFVDFLCKSFSALPGDLHLSGYSPHYFIRVISWNCQLLICDMFGWLRSPICEPVDASYKTPDVWLPTRPGPSFTDKLMLPETPITDKPISVINDF